MDHVEHDAVLQGSLCAQGHPPLGSASQPTVTAALNSYSLAQCNLAAGNTVAVHHVLWPQLAQQSVHWLAFSPDARHIRLLSHSECLPDNLACRLAVLCAFSGDRTCDLANKWQPVDSGGYLGQME